jgi:hypothetical protein
MQLTSEMIYQEALKLPDSERFALVSRLLETMPPDDPSASLDDASSIEELDRRFADREGSIAWSDLRTQP